MAEEYKCNASDFTFTMFCCTGAVFKILHVDQLVNQSKLLENMKHCFGDCHMSSHMDLLEEMISATGGQRSATQYDLHECPSAVEQRCRNDLSGSSAACLLILTVSLLAGALGNLSVIASILYERKLRNSPSGLVILSLAFSDFSVALFIIPLKLKIVSDDLHFCQSVGLCRAYITIDNILFVASITNIFVLTVDRYMGIQYGFGFIYRNILTKRRVKGLIIMIWLYAITWGVAGNIDWEDRGSPITISDAFQCVSLNRSYITAIFVLVFHIPIALMGVLYTKIFGIAHRHATEIDAMHKHLVRQYSSESRHTNSSGRIKSYFSRLKRKSSSCSLGEEEDLSSDGININVAFSLVQENINISSSRKGILHQPIPSAKQNSVTKATKTIVIVYGCFIVCWLPVSVLAIGLAWSNEKFITAHVSAHLIIVDILPVLNSTLNPFIYFIINSRYRKSFWRIMNRAKNVLFDSCHTN